MRKLLIIFLIILGFLVAVGKLSHTFDGDFGWHLRFGKEATEGAFPYTDTYTWQFYGEPWTNHEWGGDLVFWQLYSTLGYFSLVALVALAVWSAFLLAPTVFNQKITPLSIVLSIVGIYSIDSVLAVRLTVIASLFFILLWRSLEKIPLKNSCWYWPLLFWVWAALHGSWIFGFIIIGIYFVGHLLAFPLYHLFPHRFPPPLWQSKHFVAVGVAAAISFAVTALNPYGLGLWKEVSLYFIGDSYKQYITEWLPMYSYPVFWFPLLIGTLAAIPLFQAWRKKRLAVPHVLLYIALFYSAFQYRRNIIYLVLVALPLLRWGLRRMLSYLRAASQTVEDVGVTLRRSFLFTSGCALLTLMGWLYFFTLVRIDHDPWHAPELLAPYPYPLQAVQFLKKTTVNEKAYIFNEFRWGGYLNWMLPQALVFFDGRGTATWKLKNGEFALAHYRSLRFEQRGLTKLEQTPTNYILIQKSNRLIYPKPDWVNHLLFTPEQFKKIFATDTAELEKDLRISPHWKLVYEDTSSEVWRRK